MSDNNSTDYITAESFVLTGSRDPVDLAKFDLVLQILSEHQASYHQLHSAVHNGTNVNINHNADNRYDPTTQTIYWDPAAAVQTLNAQRIPSGVQSPASSFLHEIAHRNDEFLMENLQIPHPDWENWAEVAAAAIEADWAKHAGDVERDSHYMSSWVRVDNPTTHTQKSADGTWIWAKYMPDGSVHAGPQYTPEAAPHAPVFGPRGIGEQYGPGPEETAWEASGGFEALGNTVVGADAQLSITGQPYYIPWEYGDGFGNYDNSEIIGYGGGGGSGVIGDDDDDYLPLAGIGDVAEAKVDAALSADVTATLAWLHAGSDAPLNLESICSAESTAQIDLTIIGMPNDSTGDIVFM